MQFIANSIQKEIKYFLKNNILFYYIHNESEKNWGLKYNQIIYKSINTTSSLNLILCIFVF